MKTLILILVTLTGSAFGQLDYSTKPTDTEATVRMHFAIRLLRGSYTKPQEAFLLRAIANRRSITEEEAARLFTKSDLRDIFFGIGREDISTFKQMYETGKIVEKKEIWSKLTREQQTDARRINFAWAIGYLNLNEVQINFLLRFSKALPGITKDDLDVIRAEALTLFPKDVGLQLFGSIGPYTDKCSDTQQLQPRNCQCSIGSSFNMSCDGSCGGSGPSCTVTGDGCGFAWLYSCDGKCQAI